MDQNRTWLSGFSSRPVGTVNVIHIGSPFNPAYLIAWTIVPVRFSSKKEKVTISF